jgi:hypothetical protein
MLHNDLDPSGSAPGSLRRSRGYRKKVTDNPRMNKDSRNQPFILSGDGVPYFKKEGLSNRGGWPIVIRSALLPDGLWNNPALTHIALYIANEYVDGFDSTGKPRLVIRFVLLLHLILFSSRICFISLLIFDEIVFIVFSSRITVIIA